ncbi:MAG TPA: hypothetical protein DDZ51_29295 [Planctomycetaceae bacterium]|nr:hypothetical protein [Planctomycetaceae bacterium]
MLVDPLDFLLPLVDFSEPIVTAATIAKWPQGIRQRLVDQGFLVAADDADRVVCPECHDHEEVVLAPPGPGGPRYFIECPRLLRVEVSSRELRRWQVNPITIATALGQSLKLSGRMAELAAGRLWRIGRTDWQGASRDVLFARGLGWSDSASVRALIVQSRKPIIFTAMQRPPSDFWQRRAHPVLPLFQLATLSEAGIDVEVMEIAAAIQDADLVGSASDASPVTDEQLKLKIRQQIKAENQTSLTDEVFVGAYRNCKSLRAAAKFLSEETGQEINKDKVRRALERSGGAATVLNDEDSDSIVRGVASQRRDSRGKNLLQSKPKQE